MENEEMSNEEAVRIIAEHQDDISIRLIKDFQDTGRSDIEIAVFLRAADEKVKEVHQFYS